MSYTLTSLTRFDEGDKITNTFGVTFTIKNVRFVYEDKYHWWTLMLASISKRLFPPKPFTQKFSHYEYELE